MGTFTTRSIVDELIAGHGWQGPDDHDAPDNPPAVRIVEYLTPEGATCWGVVFRGERDRFRYETETQFVRQPRLLWARVDEDLPTQPPDTLGIEEAVDLLDTFEESEYHQGETPIPGMARLRVHTFVQGGFALIGADWDLDEAREAMAKYPVRRAGPAAAAMNHGVVIVRPEADGSSVFLATKEV